jgi:hypothetical protein
VRRLSATWIAITLVVWPGIVLADGDDVARRDAPRGQPRSIRHSLGATHVDGKYSLTQKPFLIEGAEQIADLGCQVIKLYLVVPPDKYPFHTQWPAAGSLVELARTDPYRSVFASSFTTFVLTAYATGRPDHYWRRGVTNEQADDETEQFYRLTHHLLTEYRGAGKTFVLQHWEGDWAIRGSYDPGRDPDETEIRGMIRWLQARQAGVERARREVGQHGVRVLHAAEVNLVWIGIAENRPTVTNRVLPAAGVDLVSYSAWDTQDDPVRLRRALDSIAAHTPDREPFGDRNVYIGEFGVPENERSEADVRRIVSGVTDVACEWGCPYVIFWQVYCNEARRQPVRENGDVRGFWLLRPDGTRSWSWQVLHEKLKQP